jgi:hypothetical protein
MGSAVDALGQPRYDDNSLAREFETELGCGFATALGCVAGADDADPSSVEDSWVAANEQGGRAPWIVEERCGIRSIASHDHCDASSQTALPHLRWSASLGGAPPRCCEIGFTGEQRGERLGWPGRTHGDGEGQFGRTRGKEPREPIGGHPLEPGE